LKKGLCIAGLFLLAMILVACGEDGPKNSGGNDSGESNGDSEQVDVGDAEELYEANCASCHGEDLSGENGPSLEAIGDEMSKDEILEQIEEGGDGMPPELIEGEDADTVAEWLAEMN